MLALVTKLVFGESSWNPAFHNKKGLCHVPRSGRGTKSEGVTLTEAQRENAAGGVRSMEYAAVAIATLGLIIGATFRLRFLLGIVLLLFPVSLVFSISRGYGLQATILMVIVPQALLQAGYFLGLLGRAGFLVVQRRLIGLSKAQTEQIRRRQDS